MTAAPCDSCPFAAAVCGCEWGGKVAQAATFAPVAACSGSVGTGTGDDLTGAQIGADAIEGDQ